MSTLSCPNKKFCFENNRPDLLNMIIFVFFRFTSSFHLVQNMFSLSKALCSPFSVSENKTTSSAYSKLDTNRLLSAGGEHSVLSNS